jgi:hypothetical protein
MHRVRVRFRFRLELGLGLDSVTVPVEVVLNPSSSAGDFSLRTSLKNAEDRGRCGIASIASNPVTFRPIRVKARVRVRVKLRVRVKVMVR